MPNLVVTIRDTHQETGLRGQIGIILSQFFGIFWHSGDIGMKFYFIIKIFNDLFLFFKEFDLIS